MYDRQVQEALQSAFTVGHNVVTDYSSPAFQVQYVPELGTGATAATAVWTSTTDITFTTAGTTPAGNDAVGASGAVTTTLYTTMGAIQDAINASRAFRCYLIAALRADLSASTIHAQAAASCIGKNGLTFYLDRTLQFASSKYAHGFAISGERFVNNRASGWHKDWDAQCLNILTYAGVESSSATGGFLCVYMGKQGSTEDLIYKVPTADATLKEINSTLSKEIQAASQPGYRLIVRFEADANTALTRFHGTGKTAVLNGTFAVKERNYTAV